MKLPQCLCATLLAASAMGETLSLPAPRKEGGMPLFSALAARKSERAFASDALSPQLVSDVLWAAGGVNRADGKRTFPTGLNVQDVDLYAMTAEGVWRYDANAHALDLVKRGDFRVLAGTQDFAKGAPLTIFCVQDKAKSMKGSAEAVAASGGIHIGAVMQNVYLAAASLDLACVARASFDRAALPPLLALQSNQSIVLALSVGFRPAAGAIDAAKAVERALASVGKSSTNVRDLHCEPDREGGVRVYEVSFKADGFEYEVEVNAATGAILSTEKEQD